MDILVNNMKRQQVGRGEALINQGEADGAHFYIVLSGAFDVYLDQVWALVTPQPHSNPADPWGATSPPSPSTRRQSSSSAIFDGRRPPDIPEYWHHRTKNLSRPSPECRYALM